jgi:hypothetical protein
MQQAPREKEKEIEVVKPIQYVQNTFNAVTVSLIIQSAPLCIVVT